MRLLAVLLDHPGTSIHSLALMATVDDRAGAAPPVIAGETRSEHTDRARLHVRRAIRATLKRIAASNVELAVDLARTVHMGTTCAYRPDPRHPPRWRVDDARVIS